MKVSVGPCDSDVSTVIPLPNEGIGRTTTSSTAAYMKSWRNPGAFSGRVNSTTMQFTNPFCFVVQVTAWIYFTAVPISPAISDTSGLSCHFNDMKVSVGPCDRDVSTVIPLPNEGIGLTTTSSMAAYMKSWRNPGAFSGRVNSTTMQFNNPFCFVVQVTAWIHFTAVPISPAISDTSGLSCHLNDMKVPACPCDSDVSTVIRLPNEGIGLTTTSSMAAYMKSWRNPGAFSGRVNSTTMQFNNPFCFVVQVTAWIYFTAVPISPTISVTSGLSCHFNDMKVSVGPCDSDVSTVIPLPNEGIGRTTTSSTAAYMKSWRNPGAFSGRVNSTTMQFNNPFCFVVQVTAWIYFTAVPISPTISVTSGLSCHLNDMKVPACPCDSDLSTVIPLPNEGIGLTTTSSMAAYMKSWRNPGAFSGRVNSTAMQFNNPFCFVVQVTAWIHFTAVPISPTISVTSGLSCHLNDMKVPACPCDSDVSTVIRLPNEGIGLTTTSSMAAYMKSWRNPGAFSGRVNSTAMQFNNPFCFVVQVTAWIHFTAVPISPTISVTSGLSCHLNDMKVPACPCDSDVSTVIPLPNEGIGRTTTSSMAAYTKSWRNPGAFSGRVNSTAMQFNNPFCFVVQVTAWIHFTAVPISPTISVTSGLSCHLNDMKVPACPCDSDVSTVIPLPNEGIGLTTTSSMAAYMKSWRNPGAFSGRVNSTAMQFNNPFCFVVQVTAWIHFTAVPISPTISVTSGLSCHLNDMKVPACPCDSDVSTVIPLPNEEIGRTTTSSMAAYMKSWRNPGAFSGRVNSTTMQFNNPFCFVVQVTAWIYFTAVPISPTISVTSGLSCHLNDMKVPACPCDSDVSTVIPLPNEGIGLTTTSSMAAYMKSWRNPGAFSGRVNSTAMQFNNPFCFVVQVTAWIHFTAVPISPTISVTSGLSCHLNDMKVPACPCDSDVSTVIPLPNEGIGRTTTSSMAAYMKSWRNPGAFSGRVNSTTMQFNNPFCFVVQVTAWIHFTAVPISPTISVTSGLSCHLNDMKVPACPCDSDVSTVIPLPNEGIGLTTTSSMAAYMKSWRNPGAFSGRVNSTAMQFNNPFCFVVQVTAWIHFTAVPISPTISVTSGLSCHLNDMKVPACPCDSDVSTVIPLPNEEIGRTTTSSMAAYMKSWRNPGAFSGRVNSTTMQFNNPFCFVVQVTAWIHFTAVPISPTISVTSGLSCHLNDMKVPACPCDSDVSTVIPLPNEGIGRTTTSSTAAYMKSWRNPGAFSGRVNSTTMQFNNPFCFVVQVTAWIHFTAVPISPTISVTSGLSCHLNDMKVPACPCDSDVSTVIPLPNEGIGRTTTSSTAAYMKSWRNPGAFSGRVNSTTMQFNNPFCFVVQVTAWFISPPYRYLQR
ncbi:hypothetical protein MRX96_042438 [Rhipicephalus microplus]